tara:strand:- start:186 stop:662 length:477 start_codon:yes stop_codon:yes gene_type:complete
MKLNQHLDTCNMKKNILLKIIVCFFILQFVSCDSNDDCGSYLSPSPSITYISIEDSEGNSLLGENNEYKPSKITLTRGTDTLLLDFSEGNDKIAIVLFFEQLESEKNYSLNLNAEETEILNLTLKINRGECFDVSEIETFRLNGAEIQPENGAYIIQK